MRSDPPPGAVPACLLPLRELELRLRKINEEWSDELFAVIQDIEPRVLALEQEYHRLRQFVRKIADYDRCDDLVKTHACHRGSEVCCDVHDGYVQDDVLEAREVIAALRQGTA